MIIELTEGGAPLAEQVREQIRGLVTTGQLAAGERLPSVRQLARDLGVAPRTVAKAYRALQEEGVLETRTGGGTRVGQAATATRRPVIEAARTYATACREVDAEFDEAVRVLRAIWPAPRADEQPQDPSPAAELLR